MLKRMATKGFATGCMPNRSDKQTNQQTNNQETDEPASASRSLGPAAMPTAPLLREKERERKGQIMQWINVVQSICRQGRSTHNQTSFPSPTTSVKPIFVSQSKPIHRTNNQTAQTQTTKTNTQTHTHLRTCTIS